MGNRKGKPKADYEYLSKRDKDYLAQTTPELMLEALANGEIDVFNRVICLLQDLKNVYGEGALSEDWKRILQISRQLYKIAEGRQ